MYGFIQLKGFDSSLNDLISERLKPVFIHTYAKNHSQLGHEIINLTNLIYYEATICSDYCVNMKQSSVTPFDFPNLICMRYRSYFMSEVWHLI